MLWFSRKKYASIRQYVPEDDCLGKSISFWSVWYKTKFGMNLEWIGQVVAEFRQDSRSPYYAHGQGHVASMGKSSCHCTSTGQDSYNEFNLKWIGMMVTELQHLQDSKAFITPMGKPPCFNRQLTMTLHIYRPYLSQLDLDGNSLVVAELWHPWIWDRGTNGGTETIP